MNDAVPGPPRLRALLEHGRTEEAAALLRGPAAGGAADRVVAMLREATGCSDDDAAWAVALAEDPTLLTDEDVAALLGFLAARLGIGPVRPTTHPPAGAATRAAGGRYPAPRGVAWGPQERGYLLARWRQDREQFTTTTGLAAARHERRRVLWRRLYVEGTPLVPLVRHPGTLAVVRHSFDPFGVDGPWWEAESRHRPDEAPVAGWLGATGGILAGPRPAGGAALRWLLSPVSGRLLDAGATGVLRRLTSGTTSCDVVAWFDVEGRGIAPAPELGRVEAVRRDADGRFAGYTTVPPLDARDDVTDALTSGGLRWVAPDDEHLGLRTGLADCPFVDAAGRWVGAPPAP